MAENLPKGENWTRKDMEDKKDDSNHFQKMEVDGKSEEDKLGEIIKNNDDDLEWEDKSLSEDMSLEQNSDQSYEEEKTTLVEKSIVSIPVLEGAKRRKTEMGTVTATSSESKKVEDGEKNSRKTETYNVIENQSNKIKFRKENVRIQR